MGGWLIAVALMAVGFLLLIAAFNGFKNGDVLGGVTGVISAATGSTKATTTAATSTNAPAANTGGNVILT